MLRSRPSMPILMVRSLPGTLTEGISIDQRAAWMHRSVRCTRWQSAAAISHGISRPHDDSSRGSDWECTDGDGHSSSWTLLSWISNINILPLVVLEDTGAFSWCRMICGRSTKDGPSQNWTKTGSSTLQQNVEGRRYVSYQYHPWWASEFLVSIHCFLWKSSDGIHIPRLLAG